MLYNISFNCNWIDSPNIHKPQVLLVIFKQTEHRKDEKGTEVMRSGTQRSLMVLGNLWSISRIWSFSLTALNCSPTNTEAVDAVGSAKLFWCQAYLAPEVKNNSSYSEKCVTQRHLELHQFRSNLPKQLFCVVVSWFHRFFTFHPASSCNHVNPKGPMVVPIPSGPSGPQGSVVPWRAALCHA